jgi:hypothetical protein
VRIEPDLARMDLPDAFHDQFRCAYGQKIETV